MRWIAVSLLALAACVGSYAAPQGSAPTPPPAPAATSATANPRVTANIDHASLLDAVAILRTASGQDVRVAGSAKVAPNAPQTATLHWSGVPFGQALRELCRAFQVSCDRRATGYRILGFARGGDEDFPAPRPGAPTFHGQGLTVTYQGAAWGSRFRPFHRPSDPERETLTLALEGATDSLDAASISQCVNVVARDDHGNFITCQDASWPPPLREWSDGYPDRWHDRLVFPFVDLHVRKLAWAEGEIVARRVTRTSLSVPFHLGAPVARRKILGADTEIEIYPERTGDRGQKEGPSIEIRQESDAGRSGTSEQIQAEFIGKSGRSYQPHGTASSSSSENDRFLRKIDLDFPLVDEPFTEVLVSTTSQGDLHRVAKFRLTDLPVPAAVPVRKDSGAARVGPAEPPAGRILFEVRGGAGPLPAGTFAVGLSRKEAAGWSPVRWRAAELDEKGTITLEDVPPGTYRIIRRFRPSGAAPAGRWIDESVTATITPGQPTRLPLFRRAPVTGK